MDLILQDARQKSMTLLDLGVNVNFAPVADVSTDPADFIYARSFGQDAGHHKLWPRWWASWRRSISVPF